MLNRLASLAMSTSVLKALPGKLNIKRHSPSIPYIATRSPFLSMIFVKLEQRLRTTLQYKDPTQPPHTITLVNVYVDLPVLHKPEVVNNGVNTI